jgi:hypothetical protein
VQYSYSLIQTSLSSIFRNQTSTKASKGLPSNGTGGGQLNTEKIGVELHLLVPLDQNISEEHMTRPKGSGLVSSQKREDRAGKGEEEEIRTTLSHRSRRRVYSNPSKENG